jgi:hypothetical protein
MFRRSQMTPETSLADANVPGKQFVAGNSDIGNRSVFTGIQFVFSVFDTEKGLKVVSTSANLEQL